MATNNKREPVEFLPYIDIMGTPWKIELHKYEEDPYFDNFSADGYCSDPEKLIVVCDLCHRKGLEKESGFYIHERMKEILRHEIVHAFLYESGLSDSAMATRIPWAKNEEMVDWIANQGEKIYKTWKAAGCIRAMNPDLWMMVAKAKGESA